MLTERKAEWRIRPSGNEPGTASAVPVNGVSVARVQCVWALLPVRPGVEDPPLPLHQLRRAASNSFPLFSTKKLVQLVEVNING